MAMFQLVLATSRISQVSGKIRENSTTVDYQSSIGLILIIGILGTIGFVIARYWSQHRANLECPERLFDELCRRHRIGSKLRAQLERIAIAAKLNQPASIFVCPDLFDRAAEVAKGGDEWTDECDADVRMIRSRLFS